MVNSPKQLECSHVLCYSCVKKLAHENCITCAVCQVSHNLPDTVLNENPPTEQKAPLKTYIDKILTKRQSMTDMAPVNAEHIEYDVLCEQISPDDAEKMEIEDDIQDYDVYNNLDV